MLVEICDTGTGIPEGARDKVFDPFFTTKEVGRGTGQGLAPARNIITDRQRGTITARPRDQPIWLREPIQDPAVELVEHAGGGPPGQA